MCAREISHGCKLFPHQIIETFEAVWWTALNGLLVINGWSFHNFQTIINNAIASCHYNQDRIF